jgi:hypothetical protein
MKPFLFFVSLMIILPNPTPLKAQFISATDSSRSQYLLEPGTERYYDMSLNVVGAGLIGIWSIAAERVIDKVQKDGHEWSVVVWETTDIE